MTAHRLLAAALVCSLGCGGSAGSGADAAPTDANSDLPADSYVVTWGPITVQPGVERVQCVNTRLGNAVPVNINQIHNVLGDVSHHLIIYKGTATEENTVPYDCDSIENLIDPVNGVPLMITQKSEELLELPSGVAFSLPENQMIRLELHYINAGDTPKDVMVTSTFIPIADADFRYSADLLFIGTPDIDIPAGQKRTVGPVYLPLPYEFDGAQYFGVTGHEHQWGTNVFVEALDTEGGTPRPVYDLPQFIWSEPETVYYDPPFEVAQGGGFRFQCDYDNRGSSRVGFGESANDEMCFFWTYYYPSVGARTCFHTDQSNAPIDVCCPGHQLCNLIGDYF